MRLPAFLFALLCWASVCSAQQTCIGDECTDAQGPFRSVDNLHVSGQITAANIKRLVLTQSLTLYRAPSTGAGFIHGNDNNNCLTQQTPCLTRNRIWNLLVNNYDLNGFGVTIQDGDGTYTDDFHPAGNVIGNTSYTTITFQGNLRNPGNVVWSQGSVGTTLEGGGAGSGPNFAIRGVKIKGAGTGTLITLTQWASLYLDTMIIGCNAGAEDINPSVGSRLFIVTGVQIDKSDCSFSTTISTTASSQTVGVGATGNLAVGQVLYDPTNAAIPPGATIDSINVGGSTVHITLPALATVGSETGYFLNCGIAWIQQDPLSVVNMLGSVSLIGTGVPCYTLGFVAVNAAQFFVNNPAAGFNSTQAAGPPFYVQNGGAIYAPATAGLNYFPGQVYNTANLSFIKSASVLTFSQTDYSRITDYMNKTGEFGLAITGTGLASGATLTDVNRANGTALTIPISLPTQSATTNVSLTYGGIMVSGGQYFTSASVTTPPPPWADYSGIIPWTPTDGSGAGLTFSAVNFSYQHHGNITTVYGTLTYPTTADGSAAKLGSFPDTIPNAAYAKAETIVTGITNTCLVANIGANTFSFISCSGGTAVVNSSLSTVTVNVQISFPTS